MTANRWLFSLAVALTLLGALGASIWGGNSWWGINHLSFLPSFWTWLFSALAILIVVLGISDRKSESLEGLAEFIDQHLFEGSPQHRILIAVAAVIVFWLLRMPTHFLGDGYEWIGNFGNGESYIHKWAEPGSSYLVRWLQIALGGYTKDTALLTFQILSVVSGAVAVYAILGLVRNLAESPAARLVALATLLFSGTSLLYFGYVEFYPLMWAGVLVFFCTSLAHLQGRGRWWPPYLAFVLTALMHLQIVILIGGIAFLVVSAINKPTQRKAAWSVVGLATLAGFAGFVYLYQTRIDVRVLMLPFFEGRGLAPNYSVVCLQHWFDLLQLLLLIFPGTLVLVGMWHAGARKQRPDDVSRFLALSSAGALTFLVIYGAATTMARDWDVMALGLVPPVLWLLRRIGTSNVRLQPQAVLSYTLLSALMTTSFLVVQLQTQPAIDRYTSILNERHLSAWTTLAAFYRQQGDEELRVETLQHMDERFPEYLQHLQAGEMLKRGQVRQALRIAESLVLIDPYRSDFLQLLAYIYGRMQRYDDAERLYEDAILLRPYYADLKDEYGDLLLRQGKNEEAVEVLERARQDDLSSERILARLGLAYARTRRAEEATAVADTLFMFDPDSPAAHLLLVEVALQNDDLEMARSHYKAFLEYGQSRPDYEGIRKHFQYLIE